MAPTGTRRPAGADAPLVLLYDGECAACHVVVQFILGRDRRRTMRFAALAGAHGQAVIARHPALQGVDSLVLVEGEGSAERVWVKSDAVLRIARYLGGVAWAALPLGAAPRRARDAMYDAFARRRYRLFGRAGTCLVPPPGTRARFLDEQGGASPR
jgi:predicted DCC family thiol-disulfide oxidoreductase YuxK